MLDSELRVDVIEKLFIDHENIMDHALTSSEVWKSILEDRDGRGSKWIFVVLLEALRLVNYESTSKLRYNETWFAHHKGYMS